MAGLDGQTVLIIGGIGTAVQASPGFSPTAAMPSSVKAMPGDEDQLDEVVETEAEPIERDPSVSTTAPM